MKKIFTLISLLTLTLFAGAQTIYICKDGAFTKTQLTDGFEVNPHEVDSITFAEPKFPAPVVGISFTQDKATVDIPAYAKQITATISGTDVIINNTQTEGLETTYHITGTCNDGSITINGSYKLTVELDAANITSSKHAPLDIQCGKRCAIILKNGTNNSLADASTSTSKAALYCKGHLEFEGGGTLSVTGNANHAIASKEYTQLKSSTGTINIIQAANDAFHIGQYFLMSGGNINIDGNTTGDGIQVELTSDATDENNGQMILKGGTITTTISHEDCKALKADSDITISGGSLTLHADGNGTRGIQTDGNITIGEETGTTTIKIYAAGNKCTLPECAEDPHKCNGIKADGTLTINAGHITIETTGKKAKSVNVGEYIKNGGTVEGIIL